MLLWKNQEIKANACFSFLSLDDLKHAYGDKYQVSPSNLQVKVVKKLCSSLYSCADSNCGEMFLRVHIHLINEALFAKALEAVETVKMRVQICRQ